MSVFLSFFVRFCYILRVFFYFCVRVWVCAWLISTACIHIVTIGDQLDELCSFSGNLPHVYTYINNIVTYVTFHFGE